jgi:hypothetical protein
MSVEFSDGNTNLTSVTRYYSVKKPGEICNYWSYDENGNIVAVNEDDK